MKEPQVKDNTDKDTETRSPIDEADLKRIRGGAAGSPSAPRPLPSTHVCRHDPFTDPLPQLPFP